MTGSSGIFLRAEGFQGIPFISKGQERLIERKISTGSPKKKAIKFVEFSDMANATLCLDKTKPADLELYLSETGYVKQC